MPEAAPQHLGSTAAIAWHGTCQAAAGATRPRVTGLLTVGTLRKRDVPLAAAHIPGWRERSPVDGRVGERRAPDWGGCSSASQLRWRGKGGVRGDREVQGRLAETITAWTATWKGPWMLACCLLLRGVHMQCW